MHPARLSDRSLRLVRRKNLRGREEDYLTIQDTRRSERSTDFVGPPYRALGHSCLRRMVGEWITLPPPLPRNVSHAHAHALLARDSYVWTLLLIVGLLD